MNKAILSLTLFLLALCGNIRAQQADTLSIRQQNIVAIAANTATSDLGSGLASRNGNHRTINLK